MDKVSSRVKALKRQLDEAEEECTRINSQKRKIQRELDEAIKQSEVLQQENEQLKSKLRAGGDKLRCVHIIRTVVVMKCIVAPYNMVIERHSLYCVVWSANRHQNRQHLYGSLSHDALACDSPNLTLAITTKLSVTE